MRDVGYFIRDVSEATVVIAVVVSLALLVNKSCDISREIALKQIEACKAIGGYVIGNSEISSERQCVVTHLPPPTKQ
jgi:hypothetical protein